MGAWRGALAGAACLAALCPSAAPASSPVGTSLPQGFPTIVDRSLGVPVIGFGAAGRATRVPVVFLHGNNDTPFPTRCNPGYGRLHGFARYLHERGYELSELWGLGYQGEQCDLAANPTIRSSQAHTATASVPELRDFVRAVLDSTGARRVDIVGHSLGVVLARDWMRQDSAHSTVRRLIAIDGPNYGIINCSPSPLNYFQLAAFGGFNPNSGVCLELGSVRTPFLATLNAGDDSPGPTEYTAIVNADRSFVYHSEQDGLFPAVPAQDRDGRPHDFSRSAYLDGARIVELRDQQRYGGAFGSSHTAIANSPEAMAATYEALRTSVPYFGRLAVRVSERRLRGGRYRLTVTGGLQPARPDPCTGSVRIRIGRERRTRAMTPDCTFRIVLRVRLRRSATLKATYETFRATAHARTQ